MATFTRLEVFTDVVCNGGVRVAALGPSMLVSATLKTSLSGVESLSFVTSRTFTQAAEIVHGRVVRVCCVNPLDDTEWRISDDTAQSGVGDQSQLTVECQSIAMDLARAPFIEWGSNGEPALAITGLQLTATEWLTAYVLPACVEASLCPITVGTVSFTNLFDLEGEFVTALQIVRAICEPGRAPGEFTLRRNGNTDYQIDILATGATGASANVVRVQTAKNLLSNVRTRRLNLMATKVIPRGSADGITRTMARAAWRVKTVVSGTIAELEDPAGGAGPIAFDDQLNGLYVAPRTTTFGSQVVTASVAATQRITITSTAGWVAGTTIVEFRSTSGASGRRLAALSHPTRALAPSAGGYGKITRFLDVPGTIADANLVPNPRARTWTVPASPPDGWAAGGTGSTIAQESTITHFYTDTLKLSMTVGAFPTLGYITGPVVKPFTTAGLLHAGHVWVYPSVDVKLTFLVFDVAAPATWYGSVISVIPGGAWSLMSMTALDLSAAGASGVQLEIRLPDITADVYVAAWSLSEGAADIADVEYSGGTVLWQRANVALAAVSSPVAGYAVQLADLARLDGSAWADEPLTLGGNIEVNDTDLADTTTQRVVELSVNLLNPLQSTVQLSNPTILASETLAQ